MQRVDKATLKVGENLESISCGVICYVVFLKDTKFENVENLATKFLNIKIYKSEEIKKASNLIESKIDLMIIPQASLSGKMKGNSIQFHSLLEKIEAEKCYKHFVQIVRSKISTGEENRFFRFFFFFFFLSLKSPKVVSGIYSNTQELEMKSVIGPNTTELEF